MSWLVPFHLPICDVAQGWETRLIYTPVCKSHCANASARRPDRSAPLAAISAPAQAHPTPAPADKPSVSRPPRVEIIALTGDDALLEQLGQALDGEATFRHVESVDAAREFIRPLRPCVLLLDARGQQDLPATVGNVQSPDGTCIVVVLAPPDEIANIAHSLKGSATFAILSIPFEQSQTIAVRSGDGRNDSATAEQPGRLRARVDRCRTFSRACNGPARTRCSPIA
jgi:hypothetical protein